MVLFKKMALFPTFFLGNIGQKNVFYDILKRKNAFLGYKKKFKKSKNCIFPRGSTNGFGPKMAIFPNFFIQAIWARKMSFTIFQNKKTSFQAIKTRSSTSRKLDIFSKGLTHGFGPNMTFFPISFLGNIGQKKVFYDILERRNAFLGYKNKKFKKSKNCIFPRESTHGFGPQITIFPNFFIQAIWARKMSFTIFSNKKTPVQATKTRSSKSRKIDIFSKGLTHGFGPNMAFFPTLFLGNIGQKKVFYDILERKNAFLG